MAIKWKGDDVLGGIREPPSAVKFLEFRKAKMYSRFFQRFVLPVGVLLSVYLTFVSSLPYIAAPKRGLIDGIIDPGLKLRILPLGDSITYGWNSTSGTDGYRLGLADKLLGSTFLFVGSQRSGTMEDNYNEGHPGYTISGISGVAHNGLKEKPNIVLLHAGTNDLNNKPPPSNEKYADAPTRLGDLIDKVLDFVPDAVVLVAQIINAKEDTTEERIKVFNAAVPAVVQKRADAGSKVMVVDFCSVGTDELIDSLHPNPAGYLHMGAIWFTALIDAAAKGWITPPVGPDPDWASGLSKAEGKILP